MAVREIDEIADFSGHAREVDIAIEPPLAPEEARQLAETRPVWQSDLENALDPQNEPGMRLASAQSWAVTSGHTDPIRVYAHSIAPFSPMGWLRKRKARGLVDKIQAGTASGDDYLQLGAIMAEDEEVAGTISQMGWTGTASELTGGAAKTAAEFYATAPLAAATTLKTAAGLAKVGLTGRGAKATASIIGQTLPRIPTVGASPILETYETELAKGTKPSTAAAKSLYLNTTEIAIESLGGLMTKPVAASAVGQYVKRKIAKLFGGRGVPGDIAKAMETAQFHGIGGEFLEERATEAVQGAIDTERFGTLKLLAEGRIEDVAKQWSAEAVVFGLLGAPARLSQLLNDPTKMVSPMGKPWTGKQVRELHDADPEKITRTEFADQMGVPRQHATRDKIRETVADAHEHWLALASELEQSEQEAIPPATGELEQAVPVRASKWSVTLPLEPTTAERVNKTQIVNYVEQSLGVPVRTRVTERMKVIEGFYRTKEQLIRLKHWGELEPLAHEVAHHIDQVNQLEATGEGLQERRPLDAWYLSLAPPQYQTAIYQELAALDYDPNQLRSYEGFAEYMRHRLTGTGQAQARAPVFHKYFNEYLETTNPKLGQQLDQLERMYLVWRDQGAINRTLGQIDFAGEHTKRPAMERMRRGLRRVVTEMDDELYVVRRMQQELGVPTGTLRPSVDPYQLAVYAKQKASGIARTFVETAAINEHGQPVGPSLAEILRPIVADIGPIEMAAPTKSLPMRQFIAYWVSRRAMHLFGRSKESGFDIDDAKYIIKTLHNPVWDKVATDLTKWSDQIMDWVISAGGLSEKSADLMRAANPIWVPFRRAFLDGEGSLPVGSRVFTSGSPYKQIKGSARPIVNPMESVITQLREMIARSQKMRLASAIADLAKLPGAGKWVTKIPLARKGTDVTLRSVVQALRKMGILAMDVKGESSLDDLMTLWTRTPQYRGKANVVPVFRNGRLGLYELDKELYDSLQSLEPLQIEGVLRALSPFTRLLRLGATGINATFGLLRNPIRDALTATTLSDRRFPTPLDPLVGAVHELTAKPGSFAWRFRAMGGDISSQMGYDRAQTMAGLDSALQSQLGLIGKTLRIVQNPIDTLRKLVNLPELGPRIAEGEASMTRLAREHPGWSEEDVFIRSFNDAQDITINFTRSGRLGKKINQAAFAFNASIQGPDKFLRTLQAHPVRTVVRGLAWIGLPSIALWWYNRDEEWYKNLDPRLKYNNLFAQAGDSAAGDTVYRIPVPYDIGVLFSALPVAMLDAHYHQKPELYQGLVDIAVSQIPYPEPDALSPAIDVATNQNYFGAPIETRAMQYLPITARKTPQTPAYALALSKGFTQLGMDLSPVQIHYLVNNYSGGLPSQMQLPRPGQPETYPVLGPTVLKYPEKPSLALNQFYTTLQELRQAKSAKLLSPADAKQLARLEKAEHSRLTPIRKQIRSAQDSDNQPAIANLYRLQSEILQNLGFGLP